MLDAKKKEGRKAESRKWRWEGEGTRDGSSEYDI